MRHTGARRFVWSGTVGHGEPIAPPTWIRLNRPRWVYADYPFDFLGAGVSSRLAADIQERQSLAGLQALFDLGRVDFLFLDDWCTDVMHGCAPCPV